MRDRLLVAFVCLTVAVVAVLLVERGYSTTAMIERQEQQTLDHTADVIAYLLAGHGESVRPKTLEPLLEPGDHTFYVAPRGRRFEVASDIHDTGPHQPTGLTAVRQVDGKGELTLVRHTEVVDARVEAAMLPLVYTGLALVVASSLVALWLSRRLSRPFGAVAAAAGEIERGDLGVRAPRSRVPEADAVARALNAGAEDLDALLRRERDFAAHASHELRTPITAIRLELEDLAVSPQTSPEVVARVTDALDQVDRLNATVSGLLDASRESRLGSRIDIDLAALVRDDVTRWQKLVPRRSIDVHGDGVVAVRMPAGALLQVMDILIGNAVAHGDGAIRVSVTEAPAWVQVSVADEGERELAAVGMKAPSARGANGLSTAEQIVKSLGGQLRLTEASSTTFSVVLPRSERESVEA